MEIKQISFAIIFNVLFACSCWADWTTPKVVLTGSLGDGENDFGVMEGDTSEIVPKISAVLVNGTIIISDMSKEREYIYNSDGTLKQMIPWKNKAEYVKFQYDNILGYTNDGYIWYKIRNYLLKTPSGEIITKTPNKPGAIGNAKTIGEKSVLVKFSDKDYILNDEMCKKYIRDIHNTLYCLNAKQIKWYDQKGTIGAQLDLPPNISIPVDIPSDYPENMEYPKDKLVEEYGDFVIAPNGDVYTWKRTTDKYYVVKWTMQR